MILRDQIWADRRTSCPQKLLLLAIEERQATTYDDLLALMRRCHRSIYTDMRRLEELGWITFDVGRKPYQFTLVRTYPGIPRHALREVANGFC